MATKETTTRKFIKAGLFKAELDEMLKRELAEDGYSGIMVRGTHPKTEVIISATKTQNVLGDESKRIRELTSLIEKRFAFEQGTLSLYADKVAVRGISAVAQAESLKYRLTGGMPVRKACYAVLKQIMESEAKGGEVIVSGKIKGQRAKAMKFTDGLMIHSGDPVNYYIAKAVRHVLLPQGILGIKVKIMLDHDPAGKTGCKKTLPDHLYISEPKEEVVPVKPYSEQKKE
uniref:40S ribosomal protein S3 n=1 Tax=Lepeophtheirus salmonis TaxID=72036 RepID=D3PJY5_LEPSM|nr:40S ribosomal protein S3-B [Lepeophtheirus salmonis]